MRDLPFHRLARTCLLAALVFVPETAWAQVTATAPDSAQTQSSERELEQLRQEYETLEAEASRIETFLNDGLAILPSVAELSVENERLDALRARLAELSALLAALDTGPLDEPVATTILVHRSAADGPLLGDDEQVANGDVLVFETEVRYLGRPGVPVISNLIWQLYAPSGDAVDGVTQLLQRSAEGGTEALEFRLPVENLSNGAYRVGLTHRSAVDETLQAVSTASFDLYQAVRIDELVVDTSLEATTHRPVLTAEDAPHLFVYYDVADGVESVSVRLSVVDLATDTVIRPPQVFSCVRPAADPPPCPLDPQQDRQRVGLALNPGVVALGTTAEFRVTLEGPDGRTVSDAIVFEVAVYDLALSVPATLTAGEDEMFEIGVPDAFREPFEVELDARSGLMVSHQAGSLGGTVTGITGDEPLTTALEVRVVDADGRRAEAAASIEVLPLVEFGARGPEIEITNPLNQARTTSTVITVQGRASNLSGNVTLDVNGSDRQVPVVNGAFESEVPLVPGENTVQARADGAESEVLSVFADIAAAAIWSELTWSGEGDVDFHMHLPNGEEIDYGNSSSSGAELDIDNTNGFGPEHITMAQAIPGQYRLVVVYYSGGLVQNWRVTLRLGSTPPQVFTGVLALEDEEQVVTTFTIE